MHSRRTYWPKHLHVLMCLPRMMNIVLGRSIYCTSYGLCPGMQMAAQVHAAGRELMCFHTFVAGSGSLQLTMARTRALPFRQDLPPINSFVFARLPIRFGRLEDHSKETMLAAEASVLDICSVLAMP